VSNPIKPAALAALLAVLASAPAFGQDEKPAPGGRQAELIAVLKNSGASLKDRADACRELALVGGKDAIAPLADLLGDEALSHMARYGLEPNPDPAVDEAFRAALGKVKGRPLVGVIGSVGVRRDARAVEALAGLLKSDDPEAAHASALALGRIGNAAATGALEGAFEKASDADRPAVTEGLLRCAEAFAAQGKKDEALKIYDKLNSPKSPPQVRDGASRKARMLRQEEGPRL
jgi:HEAT repeat protein